MRCDLSAWVKKINLSHIILAKYLCAHTLLNKDRIRFQQAQTFTMREIIWKEHTER